jgi:LemA protein
MSPSLITIIVLGIIIVLAIGIYNNLVRLRQSVAESWSAIDTELRRRYDLIPNLVETVKGYAAHEKGTLEAVITARNAAASTQGSPAAQAQTENILSGALRQLFALSENYPQLKANENFMQLQKDLDETENRISQARRFYNANVRELNTAVQSFPSSVIAQAADFKAAQYFEIDDNAARGPVSVKF